MLTPISDDSVELLQGDRWVLLVRVTDDNGYGVEFLPSVIAVSPDGDTEAETAENLGNGYYRAAVVVDEPGTYVVTASAPGYGVVAFRAHVESLDGALAGIPDLADVKAYLKITDSDDDAEIQDALDAEEAAQRAVCRIPVVYPADLRQALLRRVARNLELRNVPLAVLKGNAEQGPMFLPGRDPEVRRLEAPHRKLVMP